MAEEEMEKMSLEKLTSTEHIDKLLVVVGVKGWIALGTLIALSIAVIVWACLAEIPINVTGKGIVYNPDEVTRIRALTDGRVTGIAPHRGDRVHKGELLVSMENPSLNLQMEKYQITLNQLAKDLGQLEAEVRDEELKRETALKLQREADALILQELVKKREELSNQAGREEERLNLEVAIKQQEAKIAFTESRMDVDQKKEFFIEKKWKLLIEEAQMKALEAEMKNLMIAATQDGTIVDITADVGESVTGGMTLMWMQSRLPHGEPETVYAFIDPEAANLLEVGYEAKMAVAGINPQTYGLLLGRVKQIYAFSASFSSEYIGELPSQDLRDYLTGKEAKIMVLIELIPDSTTRSGYKWTTPKGPPNEVLPGMVGIVNITVQKLRPISYVLPFL